MTGIVVIDKPKNISSFDVIRMLKRNGIKGVKLGYLGTLDPMAKGVLPLLVGKATRLAEHLKYTKKNYIAKVLFGKATDSYDITGKVIDEMENFTLPDKNELNKILNVFRGKILQVPPAASAKKINGKRAYTLFRKGVEVVLEPKEITIYSLKIIELHENELMLDIECSSGTYIRSIAKDIGDTLGIPSTLSALTRTSVGDFTIEDSVNPETLLNIDVFKENMKDVGNYINHKELIYNNPDKLKNGIFIKRSDDFEEDELVKIIDKNGKTLAIYKASGNYLKPAVMLI